MKWNRTFFVSAVMFALLAGNAVFAQITVPSGQTLTSSAGTGAVTVESGGTFQLTGGQTLATGDYPSFTITGAGNSNLGALYSTGSANIISGNVAVSGSTTINTAADLTIGGTFTAPAAISLTKIGAGALTTGTGELQLTSVKLNQGTWNVNGGALRLAGTGTVLSSDTGNYQLNLTNAAVTSASTARTSALNATLSGTVDFAAGGSGGHLIWNGNLNGDGMLRVGQAGGYTVTLGGAVANTGGIQKHGDGAFNINGSLAGLQGGIVIDSTGNGSTTNINGSVDGMRGKITLNKGTLNFNSGASGVLVDGITHNTGNAVAINVNAGANIGVSEAGGILFWNGGTTVRYLNVAGALTNDGTFEFRRSGYIVVKNGGVWTQTGTAKGYANGGYATQMTVDAGGTFIYDVADDYNAAEKRFLMEPTTSNNANAILTVNGTFETNQGFYTTQTNTGNGYARFTLQNGGKLVINDDITNLFRADGTKNWVLAFGTDAAGQGGAVIDVNGHATNITQAMTGGTLAVLGDPADGGGSLSFSGGYGNYETFNINGGATLGFTAGTVTPSGTEAKTILTFGDTGGALDVTGSTNFHLSGVPTATIATTSGAGGTVAKSSVTGSGGINLNGRALVFDVATDSLLDLSARLWCNAANTTVTFQGGGTVDYKPYLDGSRAINVNSSVGRLNMDGTLRNALAVAGGTFSPGSTDDPFGIAQIDGLFTTTGIDQVILEVGATQNDLLVLNDTLNNQLADGSLLVTLLGDYTPDNDYLLATGLSGTPDEILELLSISSSPDFQYYAAGGELHALSPSSTAVPEPATWLALLLGVFGLVCLRRKM